MKNIFSKCFIPIIIKKLNDVKEIQYTSIVELTKKMQLWLVHFSNDYLK